MRIIRLLELFQKNKILIKCTYLRLTVPENAILSVEGTHTAKCCNAGAHSSVL